MSWAPGYVSPWSPYVTYKRILVKRTGTRYQPVHPGWAPPMPVDYLPGREAPPQTRTVYYRAPREPLPLDVLYESRQGVTSVRRYKPVSRLWNPPAPLDVMPRPDRAREKAEEEAARLWAFVPAQSAVRFRRVEAEESAVKERPFELTSTSIKDWVRSQVAVFQPNLTELGEVAMGVNIRSAEEVVEEAGKSSPFTKWEQLVYTPSNWLWERSEEFQKQVTPDIKGLGASIAASATAFGAGVADFFASLAAPWTVFTSINKVVENPGKAAEAFRNPYSWSRVGGSVLAGWATGKALGWIYSKTAPRTQTFMLDADGIRVIKTKAQTYRTPSGLYRTGYSVAEVRVRASPLDIPGDESVGALSYYYVKKGDYVRAEVAGWGKPEAAVSRIFRPESPPLKLGAGEVAKGGSFIFMGRGGRAPLMYSITYEKSPVSIVFTQEAVTGGVRASRWFALGKTRYTFIGKAYSTWFSAEPPALGGSAASTVTLPRTLGNVVPALPVTYSVSAGEFAVLGALAGLPKESGGWNKMIEVPKRRTKEVEVPLAKPISLPRPRSREDVVGIPAFAPMELPRTGSTPRLRRVPKPAVDIISVEVGRESTALALNLFSFEAEAPRSSPATAIIDIVAELSAPSGGGRSVFSAPSPRRPAKRRGRKARKGGKKRRYGELLYPRVGSPLSAF